MRVLPDGEAIEISGPTGFGVTRDVQGLLDRNPAVRTVWLSSNGGRIGEGRALRSLIRSRALSTATRTRCASACTLAFLAGRERLLAPSAELGFHAYAFPGLERGFFVAAQEADARDMIEHSGIAPDFVRRIYTVLPPELWYPDHETLLRAGAVTTMLE